MTRRSLISQTLKKRGRIEREDLHALNAPNAVKGLGVAANPSGRFEAHQREDFHDGWALDQDAPDYAINWHKETARTLITKNQSPDIHFDRSINPYRGCEHGCVYCFARPSHHYLGLSSGQDFERELYFKSNAEVLLRKEVSAKNYEPRPIALGVNTDAYQPEEKRLQLTRSILKVLSEFNHPVTLITKSGLIQRDIDLLAPMAEKGLVSVAISVTTLDKTLARKMEPRAAAPTLRLKTIKALSSAYIPTSILFAPIIPCLNDHEIEPLLEAGAKAGAQGAGYVLLRLPYDLKDIVQSWFKTHYPDRAARIINALRAMRGGADYDANWFRRGRGDGPEAQLINTRFKKAQTRYGLKSRHTELRTDLFNPPIPKTVKCVLIYKVLRLTT